METNPNYKNFENEYTQVLSLKNDFEKFLERIKKHENRRIREALRGNTWTINSLSKVSVLGYDRLKSLILLLEFYGFVEKIIVDGKVLYRLIYTKN